MSQNSRSPRKLPGGGSPPVVTYSRHREDELPEMYDDARVEPGFDEEVVAEWEAVEVPPEPPLHARRRAKPLVEEVRAPLDPERFPDERVNDARPPKARREKPRRSTAGRLVAVVAAAAIVLGIGILAYTFMSSGSATRVAPTLGENSAAPGTVPAEEPAADAASTAVREIPLNSDGGTLAAPPPASAEAGGPPAAEPVNTVPVAPPAPRPRPEPPVTATVQPDFDQAAPAPPPPPAVVAPAPMPQVTAPANTGAADEDFIANIERTLQQTRGGAEPPALSPATGQQPIQLSPQLATPDQPFQLPPPPEPTFGAPPQQFPNAIQSLPPQQGAPVPPVDIPMLDGQAQPIQLPNDYLLDTD